MSCKDFGLPEPDKLYLSVYNETINIIDCKKLFDCMYSYLNKDQQSIFNELINNNHKMHFIDGPGGSGKTFLYKTLIYYILSIEKKVLSMALTGIASVLLPRGMTSHRILNYL